MDGGRAWSVSSYAQPAKPATDDRTVSYFNKTKTNAFRLHHSQRPGVTMLEETASGGRDWMPIADQKSEGMMLHLGYEKTCEYEMYQWRPS